MKTLLYERAASFKNAIAGLCYVIRTQKNAWIHALATIIVLFLAVWLKISSTDWAILILTIGGVWTAEFINT
jgi:diacylglycerol kinase (ATP)